MLTMVVSLAVYKSFFGSVHSEVDCSCRWQYFVYTPGSYKNTYNIFCKNIIFRISTPNNIFLLSLEENEYAGIKYPVVQDHPE